jgi:hypothetical protein
MMLDATIEQKGNIVNPAGSNRSMAFAAVTVASLVRMIRPRRMIFRAVLFCALTYSSAFPSVAWEAPQMLFSLAPLSGLRPIGKLQQESPRRISPPGLCTIFAMMLICP